MAASKTIRHQDYDLLCSAKVAESGRFTPELVVSKVTWPTRPRVIAVARGPYASEEAAIDAAFAQGVIWVQHHG